MPRYLKILLIVAGLTAGALETRAFSLGGPFEGWQTAALGYNPRNTDIVAPKNLTEEYRWNQPVITYGFTPAFTDYFGAPGVQAVESAFAILNRSMSNLFSMPANESLMQFPLVASRANHRARALLLSDLKSTTLGMMMEQLGLASAERWVWAMRQRLVINEITNYFVIQRNFDPFFPHNPSRYVNGTRYTYQVVEFVNPNYTDAVELPLQDPEMIPYTSLSSIPSFGNTIGTFYSNLTRDDAGGLRYIYGTNNVNIELPPPGTQVYAPNYTNLVLVTNLDLTLLSARSLTSSLPSILSFYPGIIPQSANPRATNVGQVPIVTNIPVPFLTNRGLLTIITNQDLNEFSRISRTSAPPVLQALYPGLIITSTNTTFTTRVDIESIVLTNAPNEPWGDPLFMRFVLHTNYVTNLVLQYQYTYRNVITNYFGPTTLVQREIYGVEREPWSNPLNPTYATNITLSLEPWPSGGIIIVPPDLFGYEIIPGSGISRVFPSTNIILATNFISGNLIRSILDQEVRYFTNTQYAAYPIEFSTNAFMTVTNFVTNTIVAYDIEWANVITNYSGPTTPVVTNTYTITTNLALPAFPITNLVSIQPGELPLPSGGFLIDTNLTGFEFFGIQLVTNIMVTNVLVDIVNPQTGVRTVSEVVYTFTNTVYSVFPFELTDPLPTRRPGVGPLRFVRIHPDPNTGIGFNYTNNYRAFVQRDGLFQSTAFRVVQTQPDILIDAEDLGTYENSAAPVPWGRSINLTNSAAAPLGGPGVILPGGGITFNRVGPGILNLLPLDAPTEAGGFQMFVWGSFDGTTNEPIVYPQVLTLEELEYRVLSSP